MKIVLLSEKAKIPTKGSQLAAGYDLYVPQDTIINPGRNLIPLDFAITLLPGWEGHIRPRSGFSLKGLEGHNINDSGYDPNITRFDADVLQGTIDADYTGCVCVIVKSYEAEPFIVTEGTRIAQMVIGKHYSGDFIQVSLLNSTDRGESGFGSTGTH